MRESRSFYARWSRRKLESKTNSDVVDNSVSTERDGDAEPEPEPEPAVPALTDADMPALETLHDDSEHGHENQTEAADAVSQVDDDAVLGAANRSPTSS